MTDMREKFLIFTSLYCNIPLSILLEKYHPLVEYIQLKFASYEVCNTVLSFVHVTILEPWTHFDHLAETIHDQLAKTIHGKKVLTKY